MASSSPRPWVHNLLALDRLGLTAGQAIAVEDSPHGAAAARAAGLRCIAIPNPHADPAAFGSAALVLASAADLSLVTALAKLPG